MRFLKTVTVEALFAGAVVVGALTWHSPAIAAAGDECVKVLGYEWSGEKQSMDPADMHSGDDAYHIFSVYNRLVDALLARLCIRHEMTLLTTDKDFLHAAKHCPLSVWPAKPRTRRR